MSNTNEIADAVASAAELGFVLVDMSRSTLEFKRNRNEKLICLPVSPSGVGDKWAYEVEVDCVSPDQCIATKVRIENLTLSLANSYGTGQMRILGTGTTIERAISVALDQVSALYERLNGR